MDKNQLEKEREYSVVKSNTIIQKARYQLTANQQKVILYTISKIKPEDDDLSEYAFDIRDLCEVFGIGKETHNYEQFVTNIKELADKSFWVKQNNEVLLFRWFSFVRIDEVKKIVYLSFESRMKPFLLMLKDSYTTYKLEYVLPMKGKYTIRLYEILKSYSNLRGFACTVAELRETLMIDSYDRWNNFKVRVLDKAIEDINKFSDIEVTYETVKEWKTVSKVIFRIKSKNMQNQFFAKVQREKALEVSPGEKQEKE